MYDDASKFVFGFHSEASHHDNNVVETADEDLYNLLKFLSEGHYLRNTLVILMSDHGARFRNGLM
jgi:membrane-anchored protein YejM (alkaline phosphatase superfamily)